MINFTFTVIAVLVGSLVVEQVQCARTVKNRANNYANHKKQTSGPVVNGVPLHCFPAVGFKMPKATPTILTNWWCNTDTEYAFVGFSYDISNCDFFTRSMFLYDAHHACHSFSGPSLTQLKTDFSDMRKTFNTRYVRLYEACDNKGF